MHTKVDLGGDGILAAHALAQALVDGDVFLDAQALLVVLEPELREGQFSLAQVVDSRALTDR